MWGVGGVGGADGRARAAMGVASLARGDLGGVLAMVRDRPDVRPRGFSVRPDIV